MAETVSAAAYCDLRDADNICLHDPYFVASARFKRLENPRLDKPIHFGWNHRIATLVAKSDPGVAL